MSPEEHLQRFIGQLAFQLASVLAELDRIRAELDSITEPGQRENARRVDMRGS
jgi:hypothetical protein